MNNGWHRAPFAVFDTETTGVNPLSDRIVTAALGTPGRIRHWQVNPGVPIPAEASAVHGIMDADVAGWQDHDQAQAEIVSCLASFWDAGVPVVAYNAPFDLTLALAGYQLEPWGPIVDPMVIDRALDPYRRGGRRLAQTCAHYGVRLDQAHDVVADALAAGRVAWAICERYPWIASMDPVELHERQIAWKASQNHSLQLFSDRTGKGYVIENGWPVYARSLVEA